MVSSTLGSSTNTFWKRRSSAASFSMYWRYSSNVVAPTQCNSPRAKLGFNKLPASMAPSVLPAPTMVWISSINKMTRPSSLASSFNTAFKRSSNSPRYFAPAINAPISRESTRLFFKPSGTSPFTIRCANPSTMAVLPTPGSPISTGLFLVRRCNTWMVRRISSSRPITGSNLPLSARAVKSIVYFSKAWRLSSAFWSFTFCPPRIWSMACKICSFFAPHFFSISLTAPFSSKAASKKSSEEINLSCRCCANLSHKFKMLSNWRESCTSPPLPDTCGSLASSLLSSLRNAATFTPLAVKIGATEPSCWFNKALNKCTGSINWLSLPIAKDCASAMACWNLVVNFSIFISIPFFVPWMFCWTFVRQI